MENLIDKNHDQENEFTERKPTNEERWANDVNEEFGEDAPLVNEDPTEDIPLADDKDIEEEPPLDDEELAGEIPVEEDTETEFVEDDLFRLDDSEDLEDNADDLEFK